ncbi:unnamed protein product [Adineta steineri]|uniref:5'-3' exoribonuclease n=1 Tax=Adineta steineri TaxID=433720 RepID=A0A814AD95_9BILA|nr:unnamed protein product [Adineta steineri]CAF0913167.1 unnamed protein product [Adineta steineri]
MGIPGLSSWLTKPENYPDIIIPCEEDGQSASRSVKFDNLYLDMNEIIYLLIGSDSSSPIQKEENEIIQSVFVSIDRIFSIVRPQKLLYMALDGVAPMAKMNDLRKGRFLHFKKQENKCFDTNLIKSGTPFMSKLSNCLQDYIRYRMNTDPAWRSIKVILSNANVPGEGEHKIMDYIRQQRAEPDYDPATYHVVYSADSDVILLALTIHTNYFRILRISPSIDTELQRYEFINLAKLRTNLENDLKVPDIFQWNPERAIDDWVFLCFLAGNDFFPNLPLIEFYRKNMNFLRDIYKESSGYLTENGQLNMNHLKKFLTRVAGKQVEIFEKEDQGHNQANNNQPAFSIDSVKDQLSRGNPTTIYLGPPRMNPQRAVPISKKEAVKPSSILPKNSRQRDQRYGEIEQEPSEVLINNDSNDSARLGGKSWHKKYYREKFNIDLSASKEFPTEVAQDYVRGLHWILQYYFKGVPSWDWYYPHHYAPFACDISNLKDVSVVFNKTSKPLKPLEQLLAIFPPQYANYLPKQWQQLMLDKESPIIDFYPSDFKIDLNGKREESQGVTLLPFVNKEDLLQALESVYSTLTLEEEKRNRHGYDRLFIHTKNPCYKQFSTLYDNNENQITETNPFHILTKLNEGITGKIWVDNDDTFVRIDAPIEDPITKKKIKNNQVLSVNYRNLRFHGDCNDIKDRLNEGDQAINKN